MDPRENPIHLGHIPNLLLRYVRMEIGGNYTKMVTHWVIGIIHLGNIFPFITRDHFGTIMGRALGTWASAATKWG